MAAKAPAAASTTTVEAGSPSVSSRVAMTGTPMATMTSPRAMMTMRAWRSAKWPKRTIHSLPPAATMPRLPMTMATIHRATRASPSTNEPAMTMASDSPDTAPKLVIDRRTAEPSSTASSMVAKASP